jgi:hypothetical protein
MKRRTFLSSLAAVAAVPFAPKPTTPDVIMTAGLSFRRDAFALMNEAIEIGEPVHYNLSSHRWHFKSECDGKCTVLTMREPQ